MYAPLNCELEWNNKPLAYIIISCLNLVLFLILFYAKWSTIKLFTIYYPISDKSNQIGALWMRMQNIIIFVLCFSAMWLRMKSKWMKTHKIEMKPDAIWNKQINKEKYKKQNHCSRRTDKHGSAGQWQWTVDELLGFLLGE